MTGLSTMTLLDAVLDATFQIGTMFNAWETTENKAIEAFYLKRHRQSRRFTVALKERLTELEQKAAKYDAQGESE